MDLLPEQDNTQHLKLNLNTKTVYQKPSSRGCRWLAQRLLLVQRTQVQLSVPTPEGSQPPTSLAPADAMPALSSAGTASTHN